MEQIHELVTETIRQLTGQWIANGTVAKIREIGDGLCEDFAQEVLDRVHAAMPETADVVVGLYTDSWWLRDMDEYGRDLDQAIVFEADIARLRSEGAPLPGDIPDEELSCLIGQATHMWIGYGGLHFDATAPEGVPHFLLMPFFANQIDGYRAERQGHADAEHA